MYNLTYIRNNFDLHLPKILATVFLNHKLREFETKSLKLETTVP